MQLLQNLWFTQLVPAVFRVVARSKMWGGHQSEHVKGIWRLSRQQGTEPPAQGVKFLEAESFLVLVHPQEWAN